MRQAHIAKGGWPTLPLQSVTHRVGNRVVLKGLKMSPASQRPAHKISLNQ